MGMTDWPEYEVRRAEWHRRLRERDVALATVKVEFETVLSTHGEELRWARARHAEAWARVDSAAKMENIAYARMMEALG